jgi:hypothetical protein
MSIKDYKHTTKIVIGCIVLLCLYCCFESNYQIEKEFQRHLYTLMVKQKIIDKCKVQKGKPVVSNKIVYCRFKGGHKQPLFIM